MCSEVSGLGPEHSTFVCSSLNFTCQEHTHTHQEPGDSNRLAELCLASYKGELDKVKRLVEDKKLNPLHKDSYGDMQLVVDTYL